jgi:hypothetical protein
MSTFTPNELAYRVTPPAIDAAGLTTTYGEARLGSGFDLARDRGNVRRHIGLVEAFKASVGAERCDALAAAGVRPTGVWL